MSQLRDALKSTQQREREGRLDLEASKEKQSGLRMTITSLEEKLIRVSQSNVEANGAEEEKKKRRRETKRETKIDVDGCIELIGLTRRFSRSIDT